MCGDVRSLPREALQPAAWRVGVYLQLPSLPLWGVNRLRKTKRLIRCTLTAGKRASSAVPRWSFIRQARLLGGKYHLAVAVPWPGLLHSAAPRCTYNSTVPQCDHAMPPPMTTRMDTRKNNTCRHACTRTYNTWPRRIYTHEHIIQQYTHAHTTHTHALQHTPYIHKTKTQKHTHTSSAASTASCARSIPPASVRLIMQCNSSEVSAPSAPSTCSPITSAGVLPRKSRAWSSPLQKREKTRTKKQTNKK